MRIKNLFLINFLFIALFASIAAFSISFYFYKVHDDITTIIKSNLEEVNATGEISLLLNSLSNLGNLALLSENADLKKEHLEFKNYVLKLNRALNSWKQAINFELQQSTHEEEITAESNELSEWASLQKDTIKLLAMIDNIMKLPPNKRTEYLSIFNNNFLPLSAQINNFIALQQHRAQKEFDEESKAVLSSFSFNSWLSLVILLFLLLITMVGNVLMASFIIKRLNKFKSATEKIATGNYDTKINLFTKDEFGNLAHVFHNMTTNISNYQTYIESIINIMPSMLIITSAKNKIQLVNNRVLFDLGYEKEELIDKDLKLLFSDAEQPQIIFKKSQTSPQPQITDHKLHFKTKNNETIPVLFSTAGMKLHNSEEKLIHIAQNISVIEEMEHELIKTAKQSGMAEVATYVLHNIGNILNSINTAIIIFEEKIKASPMHNFPKIVDIIEKNKENMSDFILNDKQGQLLPKYLSVLAKNWESENAYFQKETLLIKRNIEHISKIIHTQQTLAGSTATVETVIISELVNEALQLNDLHNKTSITIERDYQPIRQVIINRTKLMQACINLISNAITALIESKNKNKKLILRIFEKNNDFFVIQVIDNGVGILTENLNKIFMYGFTTKENGHGFGLHGCAVGVKEMKGTIEAFSEGLNHGASFTLTLPYKPLNKAHNEILKG